MINDNFDPTLLSCPVIELLSRMWSVDGGMPGTTRTRDIIVKVSLDLTELGMYVQLVQLVKFYLNEAI